MTYRRFAAAGALALGLFLAFLCASRQVAEATQAADLCVDSYASIQDAINSAGDGHTVRVPVGHYTETLAITESITLQGGWSSGCTSRVTTDPAQTVIDGNQAGSVIRITSGSPTIEGLTITGGRAAQGGGVHVSDASPALRNTIVSGNVVSATSEDTYGAGVYAWRSTVTLDDTDVVNNVGSAAPGYVALGAGLAADYLGEFALVNTRIISNVNAPGHDVRGGGIFLATGGSVTFGAGSIIAHNQARAGGGIYVSSLDPGDGIQGALIVSNTAAWYGGGIAVYGGSGGVLANNVIAGNRATSRGSGVFLSAESIEVANNTLAGNDGGVGIAVDIDDYGAPVISLTNNIIAGHVTGIRNLNTTVSPTLTTNDLWDNDTNYEGVLTGTTDIHVDPQFVDAAGGDYHLADGSLLLDAGPVVPWLKIDFEGDPRPIGTTHDIGADEFARFVYLPLVLRAFAP